MVVLWGWFDRWWDRWFIEVFEGVLTLERLEV